MNRYALAFLVLLFLAGLSVCGSPAATVPQEK